jgi:hypothetical protein
MGKTTEQAIAGISSLSESTYLWMRQPNGNNNATTWYKHSTLLQIQARIS